MDATPQEVEGTFAVMAAAMLVEACGSQAEARRLAARWSRKIAARSAQTVIARSTQRDSQLDFGLARCFSLPGEFGLSLSFPLDADGVLGPGLASGVFGGDTLGGLADLGEQLVESCRLAVRFIIGSSLRTRDWRFTPVTWFSCSRWTSCRFRLGRAFGLGLVLGRPWLGCSRAPPCPAPGQAERHSTRLSGASFHKPLRRFRANVETRPALAG